MQTKQGAISLAVAVVVVAAVTAALWYGKITGFGPRHPVFFYLLPIALVALLHGSRTALLCVGVATLCAAFFLYDPIYSFRIAGRLAFGDLICFAILAAIGIKCTRELFRPAAKISATRSRYSGP